MKKIIFLMFWLLINNNLFAGEISIYYPSGMQELCRTTPLVVKWTGSANDVIVEIKKENDSEYKSVINYQINNNTFLWTVNDAKYLNVPLSVRVSDKNNPENFDEFHGITVFSETVILQQTQSFHVCSGDDIYLQIDALGYNLSYQWYKDNKPIEGAVSSVLRYSNADYSYSGTYVCKIKSNSPCGIVQSNAISVYVAAPTKFTTRPEEVFWEYNKSATMTAILHANNDPEINNVKFRWFKDTVIYTYNPELNLFEKDTLKLELNESKKYIGTNSQDLEITKLVWNDRTTYYCVADGLCGSDTVSCVIGDESRFEIIKMSPNFFGCEGQDITFKAKVITNVKGTFTYQWYKTGFKIINESEKYTGTKTLELKIKNANRKEDWYNYYVLVTWVEKKVSKRSPAFEFDPKYPPEIADGPRDWLIKERRDYYVNSTFLSILVYNFKVPKFDWYKDGKLIAKGGSGDYVNDSDSARNVGWYKCKITNECGSVWSDSAYVGYGYDDTGECLGRDLIINITDWGDKYYCIWKNKDKVIVDSDRIKGASTSKLVIYNLQLSDEGPYKVWMVNKLTQVKHLVGNIFVEAREAPYIIVDFPSELKNEDDYIKQTPITVISQSPGVYYTLYIDGEPVGEEKFKPTDIFKRRDFGFVHGGRNSNLKPGVYQYHFRNQCGEVWSNKMTVTNTDYIPGGIVMIGDDEMTSDVSESLENGNIRIYPNPAEDYLIIQTSEVFETSEVYKVNIFDMLGIEVSPAGGGVSGADGGGFRIDVSHLPAGVYYIKIGDRVEKFVKM